MEDQFKFDRRAIAEADEAREWMSHISPEWADRWYRRLFEQIITLNKSPMRCPKVEFERLIDFGIQELLYGKRRNVYRILFLVDADVIRILTIWPASRGAVEL